MNCRVEAAFAAAFLCLAALPAAAQISAQDRAFHQMSLPGFAVDCWADAGSSEPGSISVSYRHCVVSSFHGYSYEERPLERSRWEVYVRVGYLQGLDASPWAPGAYSSLGWTVSFERPDSVFRRVLIPYAGVELGFLTEAEEADGGLRGETGFAAAALLGVHLFSGKTFSCALESAFVHAAAGETPFKLRGGLVCSFVF